MIRNIVGALIHVGAGKAPPAWIGELLAGRDRTRGAATFAADGLYFTGADYDPGWGLPPTRRPLSPALRARAMTALRTRVKICGITAADHGLAAARAGADAIGFVFWAGTPRKVAAERAARDRRRVAAVRVDRRPVRRSRIAAQVRAVLAAVPLDVLQFHGAEPPELCRVVRPALSQGDRRPRRSWRETGLLEYAQRYGDAAGLLFDAPPADGLPGGTGRTFDWDALSPRFCERLARPIVLSGGLHAGNVGAAIRAVRPWAVDVSSGVEATRRRTAGR